MEVMTGSMYRLLAAAAAGLCLLLAAGEAVAATAGAGDPRAEAFAQLWNEHADRAVDGFHGWIEEHPENRDPDTRRGLALALSWYGLQRRAESIYTELAEENPLDGESRIGLARCRIWDNRLHAGWTTLRVVETDDRLPPQARAEAGDFALRVLDGYTPHALAAWRGSWDSDDLDILRYSALGAATVGGRALIQFGPRLSRYARPGQPDVTARRLQVMLTTGLAPHLSCHATGWFEHFGSDAPLTGAAGKLDWNRPGADVWLTWQPKSRLRFDGGAASQPVETYAAFGRELGFEQENLSCDLRLAKAWSVGTSGTRATFSDGNRRLQGRLQAGWHYEGPCDLDVIATYTHMDDTLAYPGGYWSPDWVRNGSLTLRLKRYGRRWTFALEGSAGQEKEAGSDAIVVGGGSGRIGLRLAPDWLIAFEGGHSRSSFATSSGYHRTFAGISLRGVF